MIRPEQIRIAPGPLPGTLPAQFRQSVYLGHLQRWHLQTAQGLRLVAQAGAATPPAPGTLLHLAWDPGDAWLLPEPGLSPAAVPAAQATLLPACAPCHACPSRA